MTVSLGKLPGAQDPPYLTAQGAQGERSQLCTGLRGGAALTLIYRCAPAQRGISLPLRTYLETGVNWNQEKQNAGEGGLGISATQQREM